MVLHKAGTHGHKEDYWHNFDSYWWPEFKKTNPTAMKRYQCIKNVVTDGGYIDFKAGKIYEEFNLSGWPTLVDEYGDTWNVDENLMYHFQELLDLHVDEIEADTYRMPIPDKRLGLGIAICIAVVITMAAILYSIFA